MKKKKVVSLIMAGLLAVSLAACGSNGNTNNATNNAANGEDEASKIVVWTLAEDLKTYADHYTEMYPEKEVEVVVIAPADYPTKLTTAMRGKSEVPDVLVGEPQMLENYFEAGFCEDLSAEPYNINEYKDLIVDYVFEAGTDSEGKTRAISYQVTPGGITYRRDIAKELWGDDSPEFIAEKFKDVSTVIETGRELKEAGYRIFSDTGSLRWYTYGDDAQPWVADGKLMMNDSRLAYVDAAVELYQENLVAFAPEWSAAWYASMNGTIPVDAGWTDLAEVPEDASETDVFAYSFPTWGTLILRDNAKDTAGQFGVTTGPNPYFWGGTFLGINSYSNNKDAAWDFIKFVTLNEETAQWWVEESNGDVVSYIPVLEANKDMENESLGGQKSYEFWLDQAQNVDYSLVTKYDDEINKYFGQAIESIQKGEMTKDEALKDFYKNIKTIYPEVVVPE